MSVGVDGTPVRTLGAQPGEPVAGYVTIQVADLDDAIERAAKMPLACQ